MAEERTDLAVAVSPCSAVRADAGAEGEEKRGTRRWGQQPSLLAGFLFRLGNNKVRGKW
ncbi:hypothetical protein NC653_027656 [Populus alba x Populus x berolinensis]|uniref:Uncharacterized protein n=1 Tax=Populus alba x Populus x berolinensis TaxID=444605 RepID=A0AAD6M6X0_9ROSI|nr:hypothetical protein NC653_027656 [Populus alba x Populus x berolinensis]